MASPSDSQNTNTDTTPDALQSSEERIRLLVEQVSDYAIFALDRNGCVTTWNLGASRIKGYSASEMLGQHFSKFYRPEDRWKCDLTLQMATQQGRVEDESWRVRKDGSQFWAHVVITPLRDARGELFGFANVTRDMTEDRRAEDTFAQSEERLSLLVESVKDYAIFMLDPTGCVATWNIGAERIKGYRADEIIGQHFSKFYPEEDVRAGKCERELRDAQLLGRFEDEDWRIRKDGTRFWANVVITPIREPDGSLRGFAKVTRDLTERKCHEEERINLARSEEARKVSEANEIHLRALADELRISRDKAEEATRLKDEFLATVSHELRTPLTAILGWARVLQSEPLGTERAARALDTIVRNATAQNRIIDDLLDVSHIITGQLTLACDAVDIDQILTSALEVVRPAAEAKGVELKRVLNPDAGVVRGDAARLQQVLWNLLANAVKFTPRGGQVHVTLHRRDSSVQIEVADTGQGIEADFMPRAFDRFSQQDSTNTRRFGGLGLGLAIVKHLVELHGGTVEAHSAGHDTGTRFVVKLPIAPVPQSAVELVTEEVLSVPVELSGLSVLVLDDEEDARELMQLVLNRAGAAVTLASDVTQALDAIARQKPDVIVSDIGMPGEDGYAFMRKLRSLPREDGGRIPALALTAFSRSEDRRNALAAGFQIHAAKPIEARELRSVIANLAGKSE